jgi:hypothetical protein
MGQQSQMLGTNIDRARGPIGLKMSSPPTFSALLDINYCHQHQTQMPTKNLNEFLNRVKPWHLIDHTDAQTIIGNDLNDFRLSILNTDGNTFSLTMEGALDDPLLESTTLSTVATHIVEDINHILLMNERSTDSNYS